MSAYCYRCDDWHKVIDCPRRYWEPDMREETEGEIKERERQSKERGKEIAAWFHKRITPNSRFSRSLFFKKEK